MDINISAVRSANNGWIDDEDEEYVTITQEEAGTISNLVNQYPLKYSMTHPMSVENNGTCYETFIVTQYFSPFERFERFSQLILMTPCCNYCSRENVKRFNTILTGKVEVNYRRQIEQ